MSAVGQQEDEPIAWYIGQHEQNRKHHVSGEILQKAHEQNYDMLTARITNDNYNARVLSQLTAHMQSTDTSSNGRDGDFPAPIIRPLTMADTNLSPDDTTSQLLLITSQWIDLASSDPVIADVSRQVLVQEINFAAFCGASNIVISGPLIGATCTSSEDNIAQFAHAVEEALTLGIYLNIQILLPMTPQNDDDLHDDLGHLSNFIRDQYKQEKHTPESVDALASWDAWNIIRNVCRYSSRLSVALSLPRKLPTVSVQDRWFSEPLRILNIPASTFLLNSPGHNVLPSTHQQLLYRYMRLRNPPWILLSDVETMTKSNRGSDFSSTNKIFDNKLSSKSDPTPAQSASQPSPSKNSKSTSVPEPRINYIRYLQRRQPSRPPIERFGAGYQDYLQSPLQPLTDNLESITYEVFEKDPVKYEWYERAIAQALRDWVSEGKYASGPNGRIVVAVVGAGRGPLVTRALAASKKTGIEIDMWAVEKNPNAFVLLQRHNVDDWDGKVSLVQSDMRSWGGPTGNMDGPVSQLEDDDEVPAGTFEGGDEDEDADSLDNDTSLSGGDERSQTPYTIDILVSELLGSFADNELSPECLDGAQHLLNPLHGLCIPTSYTAHFTPVAAPKLHADISSRVTHDSSAAEIPYVVMLQAIDFLSTEPRSTTPVIAQAWEFSHPLPQRTLLLAQKAGVGSAEANRHNARTLKTTFACKNRGMCHGLAGYFESVLYASAEGERDEEEHKDGEHKIVELSTNPLTIDRKSKDMISWFPIYFPLDTPIQIPDNAELDVSMWRRTDGRKVWYEWMVEAFMVLPDTNVSREVEKQRLRVGTSKLHSSEKNACLM